MEPDGHCSLYFKHNSKSTWIPLFIACLMTSALVGTLAIIFLNMMMFLTFIKLRKRLEKLKAKNEGCTTPNIYFHQTIGIFKKTFYPDIPGWNDTKIQILKIRNLESGFKPMVGDTFFQEKAKRSGSMLKNIAVLASHLRAAKYIIILVLTLLVTWTPMFLLGCYKIFLHYQKELTKPDDDDVNMRLLFSCLETVIQNGECSMDVKTENLDEIQVIEILKMILHSKESYYIGNALCCGPLLNSTANTILYAFWYPEFRRYLVQIPQWCKNLIYYR